MQLVRDAESLTASEVAQLPVALMKVYEHRSAREQQAVGSQPFFEALVKPWALQPNKLSVQVQTITKPFPHSGKAQRHTSALHCVKASSIRLHCVQLLGKLLPIRCFCYHAI